MNKMNDLKNLLFLTKNKNETNIINKSSIPIYVSLTSIFSNQSILLNTLKSLLDQTLKPNKIFLYLSEEPYLLDNGFANKKITNTDLLNLINKNNIIVIKWVNNIGSYRKLIPILKEKWNENCFIISVNDNIIYSNKLIQNFINDYNKYKCAINYSGFTPLFEELKYFDYNKKDKLENNYIYNFETSSSGILYKPEFFYDTYDLIFDQNTYLNICKNDNIWFYIMRIINNIKCYIDNNKTKWFVKEIRLNKSNEVNNNILFKNTINKLNLYL